MGRGLHVALLRAVNVGGTGPVAMADLRALLGGLGYDAPRSVLQSGNLVFGAQGTSAALESAIAAAAHTELGLATEVFVRSAPAWHALIAGNPFPEDAEREPSRFVAVVLKDAPSPRAADGLQDAIVGPERAAVVDRTAYVHYPNGQADTKLTLAVIERALGTRGTARNWNTVRKLAALVTL